MEGDEATAMPVLLGFESKREAMRAVFLITEFPGKFCLEVSRDRMFHLFGFVVDFVPFHVKDLGEHSLYEIVTADEALGDLAPGNCKSYPAFASDFDKAVTAEALRSHGNGGGGHVKPAGQGGGDYNFSFGFRFGNSLEVVFLGDCNLHATPF